MNNDGTGMGVPSRIGFDRNGKWAVIDLLHFCICLYDNEDQLVRKIGSTQW